MLREEVAKTAGDESKDEFRQVMEDVLGMFERMPHEARQALMTEEFQPVVEFANTETEVGKPIKASIATASPWGGTINRDVTISLAKVESSKAYLTLTSSIPRAELDKLMKSFVSQMTALPPDKRKEAEAALVGFQGFRHDTLSDYQVSVDDGLLDRFQSTETIEVSDKDKKVRKITTRSMQLVEVR